MTTNTPEQIQNPLNLLLPIAEPVEENFIKFMLVIEKNKEKIHEAFGSVNTVHFARVMPIDNNTKVFIITAYDGPFKAYIQNFIENLGWFFDDLLPYVEGGSALVPVAENVAAFEAFVAKDNITTGLFSAYPTLTVLQILSDAGLDS